MSGFFKDLHLALLVLARRPRYAVLVLAVLSLGIGTSVGVFSLVDGVLFKPLPYRQADRLVVVSPDFGTGGPNLASQHKFSIWRDQVQGFESLSAYEALTSGFSVFAGDHAEQLTGGRISADLFHTLGVVPDLGREFERDEERDGAHHALISYTLWQHLFGGKSDVLGSQIELDGTGYEIIGVLPRGFVGPIQAQVWLPLSLIADPSDGAQNLTVIGRLASGVLLETAGAHLKLLARNYRLAFPQSVMKKESISARALLETLTGEAAPKLHLLVGAVFCLLLIAIGNSVTLGMARLSGRRGELAVRYALGASHWRLSRMVFAESLVLSGMAGVLGLAIAFWLLHGATRWLPPEALPRLGNVSLDLSGVAVAFVLALAVALLLTTTAVVRLRNVGNELRVRTGDTRATARFRALMVAAQLILSTLLIVVSSLFIAAFVRLNRTEIGFDPTPVLAADLPLSQPHLGTIGNVSTYFTRLRESLLAYPGIEKVSFATAPPLERAFNLPIQVRSGVELSAIDVRAITPDYFATLALPLRRGRGFHDNDGAGAEPVAIVNEAYMRRYFADGAATDQSLWVGRGVGPPWEESSARRVVGIVADVHENGPTTRPPPTVFLPLAQFGDAAFWEASRFISPVLLVRSQGHSGALLRRLESLVQMVDARQAVARPRALATVYAEFLAFPRFMSFLVGGFAALSLLLAVIGLYALVSYTVQARQHEIGIRMALGATPGGILRQVLVHSLRIGTAGIGIGLLLAWPVRRWLASRLPDTPPLALGLMAMTAVVLVGATLFASFLPAWRAARINPLKALREE